MKKTSIRELRAVPRYNVRLPVCVTWRDADEHRPLLNTLTRDISTRGMFVLSELEPAEGRLLEFEIDMAWDQQTPLVVVRGAGRVVRSERALNGAGGFAVHNLWFRISEPEEGQALQLDSPAKSASPVPPLFGAAGATKRHGLTVVRPASTQDSNSTSDPGEMK